MTRGGPPGDGPYNAGTAFMLWLACCFGAFGIHRFYLGRPGTGLLYLFTLGFLGIGQIVDLVRIPALVREENAKIAAFEALAEARALSGPRRAMLPPAHAVVAPPAPERMRQKLLRAAARHGGTLSVTQGVMATGKTFAEVEALLDEMAHSGYVGIDNDPDTGMVVYTFGELAG